MSKYSKEDEKLVKEFLDNLYSHHQSLKGGSLSGGRSLRSSYMVS